jgi:hypothetical protein
MERAASEAEIISFSRAARRRVCWLFSSGFGASFFMVAERRIFSNTIGIDMGRNLCVFV